VNKPVLFCHDGSEGSRTALAAAVELIKPGDAWYWCVDAAAVQLPEPVFVVAYRTKGDRRAGTGYCATNRRRGRRGGPPARLQRVRANRASHESVAKTIDEIRQEIDADWLVCGQRGRAPSAALSSVASPTHSRHTPSGRAHRRRRPVVAPSPGRGAIRSLEVVAVADRVTGERSPDGGQRALARPGRITIARRKPRAKIPIDHQKAVV